MLNIKPIVTSKGTISLTESINKLLINTAEPMSLHGLLMHFGMSFDDYSNLDCGAKAAVDHMLLVIHEVFHQQLDAPRRNIQNMLEKEPARMHTFIKKNFNAFLIKSIDKK